MNRQNSQNEKLDRIGRTLLEAAKTPDEEIEKIVSAPNLFASVQARINAEQKSRAKRFFSNWQFLSFPKLQRISAFSALFFLCSGVFGFVLFSKLNRQIEKVSAPEVKSVQSFETTADLAKSTADLPEISLKETRPEKTKTNARKIVLKTEKFLSKKSLKSSQKQKPEKAFRPAKSEPSGEFYALNYAGNLAEKGEVLQIVRAELSPSSLFALGVNLPIENAPEKIKTDLLVGSDGIARAIRFVE